MCLDAHQVSALLKKNRKTSTYSCGIIDVRIIDGIIAKKINNLSDTSIITLHHQGY